MSKKLAIVLVMMLLIFTAACSKQTLPDTSSPDGGDSSVKTISRNRVKNTDLLAAQTQIDANLLDELEAGYDFEEPFVVVDPYGLSPLSAIALFNTDKPASISIEVEGKNGAAPLTKDFDAISTRHQIPIYGLYAEEPAQVTLTAHYEDGTSATSVLSVTGGVLPGDLIPVRITQADTSQMAEGWTFLEPAISANKPYAIDEAGEIRWFISGSNIGSHSYLQLENGNFLFSGDKDIGASENSLYEMDMTGRIVKEYMIYGYHHDMKELPNGNLLALATNINGIEVNDIFCEIRRSDGEILRIWDMNGYFDVDNRNEAGRHVSDINYGGVAGNWLHINAIDYDPGSNAVLLSSRAQDAVIKMDLDTGEVLWVLTDPNDAFPEYLEGKLLTPVGVDFEWPYGQHCTIFLPSGDVMMFDNGVYRSKTEENIVPATEGYSRAVIYRVDEKNMTVRQMWQFGKEFGSDHLASYISGVQYLGEDHYIVDFGGIFKDPDGNAYYNSGPIQQGDKRSELYEIKDNKIIFHASVKSDGLPGNTFRALRMVPYTNVQELDLTSERSRLGALYRFGLAEAIDFDSTSAVSGGPEVSAVDNGAQLVVSAALDAEAENLALVFDGGSGAYRVSLPVGDTILYTLNNSEIPTGTYDLYLEADSEVYDLELEWQNLSTYRDFPVGCRVEVTSENGGTYGSGLYFADTAFTVWAESGGTVTITPDEGYALGSIMVTDMDGKKLEVEIADNGGVYSFDMPESEVSVTVSF